ncbi:MAG: translation initiation factor IF-2 [Microcoleaceae cyanobacterium]
MNNVKVRIYELSRELNLDNKDILAVCERLNIAVKSHSSTITESDAERIEKYVVSHPMPGNQESKPERPNFPTKGSSSQPIEKKKQQILEVRKPRGEAASAREYQSSEAPLGLAAANSSNSSSAPPKPPARPVLNRPVVQPNSLTPPDSFNPLDSSDSANSFIAPELPSLDSSDPGEHSSDTLEEVHAVEQEVTVAHAKAVSVQPSRPEPQAKLFSPPARPLAEAPPPAETATPRPSANIAKIKPILKVDKSTPKPVETGEPQVTRTSEKPSIKSSKPKPSTGLEPRVARDSDSKDVAGFKKPRREITALQPKSSIPELHRPPDRTSTTPASLEDDPESATSEPDLALTDDLSEEGIRLRREALQPKQRLQLPQGPKKPGWEEEEEDTTDAAAKVAKTAKTKVKRSRKPLVDEDEDDDDDDGTANGEQETVLSLSLARPPKPKNMQAPTSKPTATPTRSKKPGPSRGNANSNNNNGAAAASTSSRNKAASPAAPQRPEKLILEEALTVQELANSLAVSETEIIKLLFSRGIAVNITETLDFNSIDLICQTLEVKLETAEKKSGAQKTDVISEEDLDHLQRRPPVVTIMGHVDHGKTTLLDAIRATKVAQGEAGGITQHIGAYHVDVEHEGAMQQVVFLDTPGHEAFTAMRARGAKVTDIAVLVVAADDGVRPQTIEAISHAKAAGVPIVVAINKIDKETANPERVKQELTEYGLVSEEWGGETIMVPVSAIRKENLDQLLEMLLLVSEVADLEANPDRLARGTVIEANLDKARGPVATLLVQNGTLRVGDVIVAGPVYGKVRAMVDDRGAHVEAATPSFAVEILGLREVPAAGDEFEVYDSEKEASAIAAQRAEVKRQSRITQGRISLSALSARVQEGELKELNLILKSDVQGSLEAIVTALKKLPQKEVQLKLLMAAPGEVTETDVDLAAASDAVLIGFNTTLANGARQAADQAGVDIREYNIIYNLLDDVQAAMEGLLEPELVEEPLGEVEVRAVFPVGRNKVAGCYVLSGKIIRNCKVRVHRKTELVHEGALDSLKRMKEDAKEVNAGYECGIGIDRFNDWIEGDIIEAYRMVTKRRTLST